MPVRLYTAVVQSEYMLFLVLFLQVLGFVRSKKLCTERKYRKVRKGRGKMEEGKKETVNSDGTRRSDRWVDLRFGHLQLHGAGGPKVSKFLRHCREPISRISTIARTDRKMREVCEKRDSVASAQWRFPTSVRRLRTLLSTA